MDPISTLLTQEGDIFILNTTVNILLHNMAANDSNVLYSPSHSVHVFIENEDDCPSPLSDWSNNLVISDRTREISRVNSDLSLGLDTNYQDLTNEVDDKSPTPDVTPIDVTVIDFDDDTYTDTTSNYVFNDPLT